MYYLETERLRVEITEPGELGKQTVRFDHTAFISEIILDGSVRFCASEPRNMKDPSSGGRGLCSEYKFDVSKEARIGDLFPKLGVGLLRKTDGETYHFTKRYPCEPFDISVDRQERSISFISHPKPCLGYAARTVRTVGVRENALTMRMELHNTGEKVIGFREYCHNFLSLGGMALGEDYRLRLHGCRNLAERIQQGPRSAGVYSAENDTVGFLRHSPSSAIFLVRPEDLPDRDTFVWSMEHQSAQISVECTESYHPAEVAVWSNNHMLCQESQFQAEIRPGESCSWMRTWTFDQRAR